MPDAFTEPLIFEPIFMERIWGGRRLETLYGKHLPPALRIGESWEIVDRPEAQSVVHRGTWRGATLHDLWMDHRLALFGEIADSPRFPLLIKLLDAEEKLSLQVHPPAAIAAELGGEPKTEFWYIADALPGAELYVGMRRDSSREAFERAIAAGTTAEHVCRMQVKTGDGMFLPGGRVHAIGAGNVIVEVQQNSDTTYRVFDWNRTDQAGKPRQLHVEQSLRCIDFNDREPALIDPAHETLISHPLFHIEKWTLDAPREVAKQGNFAIVCCLTGRIECAGCSIGAGEFFLVPASMKERQLKAGADSSSLLRVTIRE